MTLQLWLGCDSTRIDMQSASERMQGDASWLPVCCQFQGELVGSLALLLMMVIELRSRPRAQVC